MREREQQLGSYLQADCNKCDFNFKMPFITGDKIDFEAADGTLEDLSDIHENRNRGHLVTVTVKHN